MTDSRSAGATQSNGRSQLPLAAMLILGTAILLYLVVAGNTNSSAPNEHPSPPAFAVPTANCDDSRRTSSLAARSHRAARASMERYPFSPSEGAHALSLLAKAVACYRASGKQGTAENTNREATAWARRLRNDFLDHRLRLRRALKREKPHDALHQIELLLEMVGPGDEGYRRQLKGKRRLLEALSSQEES